MQHSKCYSVLCASEETHGAVGLHRWKPMKNQTLVTKTVTTGFLPQI
ncbi:hypothetical protein M728_001014 [Ensifer sp. WSM1721]